MKILLHHNDLPEEYTGQSVAIDTETMGLVFQRDRLCLIQLCFNDQICHIIKVQDASGQNIRKLLTDNRILKIFHFARFDLAVLQKFFGIEMKNIYCTKVASKLCRTYTNSHGLKELCKVFLGIELNKQKQLSDWGHNSLSEAQLQYAASDVLYLHDLKKSLDVLLQRENRTDLAQGIFDFLPFQAQMDLFGFDNVLAHHNNL